MKFVTKCVAALLALGMLGAAAPAAAQEKLVVWWVKGFYKSEDDALFEAIKKFEAKTGVKVELSQYAVQDMIPKTVAALDAGNAARRRVRRRLRLPGRSASGRSKASSRTSPTSSRRSRTSSCRTRSRRRTSTTTRRRRSAYYAFPLKQQTMHIEYWKDMLAEAGSRRPTFPTTWKEYWAFWCDKVQPDYRKKTGKRIFGTGFPMGVDSSDSYYSFLTFMDAYNVKLVDDNGKLTVNDPKVRAGLIGALRDYTMPYTKGCTPPSATSWKDPDNNVAFHNKTTIMTHNATISIAAKWFDDMNNDEAEARAARAGEEELLREHRDRRLPEEARRLADDVPRGGEDRRDVRRLEEQEARQGVHRVPAAGREPDSVRRRLARPLVSGDEVRRRAAVVLARRSASHVGAAAVRGGHDDVRIHEELQVHDPQQRERLGQGDEPRRRARSGRSRRRPTR